MSKITLSTIKKFIKENKQNLYIRVNSKFSGMSDMVENTKEVDFVKIDASKIDFSRENNFGIPGF